ncbi:MAG: FtsQ-type POTRA domain-containing protein, partial [Candidatus Parcubacteria bacterium]|nr:FtsQ-type POTRA domain-containing protein [Candidatus Parcubacteria bacterium]
MLLLIGIGGCLYFFLFSPFYDITEIEVSGNKIASSDDILEVTNNYLAQDRLGIIKNRNIFLFDRKQLTNKINELILLDNLDVNKVLPNTIKLTLTEKNAAVKWLTDNNAYLIDGNGQIIKKYYKLVTPDIFSLNSGTEPLATPVGNDNLISLVNLANQPVNLGDKVFSPVNMT